MNEEILDVIDGETDEVTGQAPRSLCHGRPDLVHRVVHVLVRHPDGRILLQKRALTKQVQPGKWDMSVGGHVSSGETCEEAVLREMNEELGVSAALPDLTFLFEFKLRNSFESENARVYSFVSPGPFSFRKEEIDSVAFFTPEELKRRLAEGGSSGLTPLLRAELEKLFSGEKS